MNTIIDYKILTATKNFEDLQTLVQLYIRNGWQPLGGVSCSESDTFTRGYSLVSRKTYAQAMVRYEQPSSNSI